MCRNHHDLLEMAVIESLPLRQSFWIEGPGPNQFHGQFHRKARGPSEPPHSTRLVD